MNHFYFRLPFQSLYLATWTSSALILLLLIRGVPVRKSLIQLIVIFGNGLFLFTAIAIGLTFSTGSLDFSDAFYSTGQQVLLGRDPIDLLLDSPWPPLNPPTSYPFFATLALLPLPISYAIWVGLCVMMAVLLVPLAHRVLVDRGLTPLNPSLLAVASTTCVLSLAVFSCLKMGQLSILAAFTLTMALFAQGRGRPILAGLALGIATIKINTLLPFLLLFFRRKDLISWLVMALVVLGLCLPIGRVSDIPRRVSIYLQAIDQFGSEGKINDYSYKGLATSDILGFDHALFRVGFRDRVVIKRLQVVAIVLLGVCLATRIMRRGGLADPSDCCLVALYSILFLYHRLADAIIFTLPLVYASSRTRASIGSTQRPFLVCFVSILIVLTLQRRLMDILQTAIVSGQLKGLIGQFVEVVILPHGTWLILVAMLCLWSETREPIVSSS